MIKGVDVEYPPEAKMVISKKWIIFLLIIKKFNKKLLNNVIKQSFIMLTRYTTFFIKQKYSNNNYKYNNLDIQKLFFTVF